jgi:thiamine-phosphate pyrophosphorylase
MKPLADCRLYTFVDTACLHGRAPEIVAQQLCDGGSDLIQLRAKKSTPDEIRRMAEKILPITKRANVGLVINDHLEIARDLGAEFCHLGQEDFFDAGYKNVSELPPSLRYGATSRTPILRPEAAEGRPNSTLRIGLSTHSPEQAKRALVAGPDYIAIGPVYATGTKPGAKPVTLDYVRWAAAPQSGVTVPWFAIGGINLKNLGDVLAAGAQRVCVVSAILDAPDVAKACAEFRDRLG